MRSDDVRLESQNIRNSVGFVPGLARLGVYASNSVHEVDTSHPLVNGKINLTGEIMKMPDQRSEHDPIPLGCLRAHGVNDTLGESRVIF